MVFACFLSEWRMHQRAQFQAVCALKAFSDGKCILKMAYRNSTAPTPTHDWKVYAIENSQCTFYSFQCHTCRGLENGFGFRPQAQAIAGFRVWLIQSGNCRVPRFTLSRCLKDLKGGSQKGKSITSWGGVALARLRWARNSDGCSKVSRRTSQSAQSQCCRRAPVQTRGWGLIVFCCCFWFVFSLQG